MYAIRSIRDGIALIEELDATRFPKEEATEPPQGGTGPSQPVGLSVDSNPPVAGVVTDPATGRIEMITAEASAPVETTIAHVMVLYTPAAKTYLASQEGVTASINLLISDTDSALGASGVQQELKSAYEWATTYQETGDPYQDWLALKNSAEIPALKAMAQMRKDHNADVVVLLTKETSDGKKSSCGQADQLDDLHNAECDSVFAAVPVNCAMNIYSFAHEIGHVMGAIHSQGFTAESNAWHTLMASPNDVCKWPSCPRIPHWSNPAVLFKKDSLPPESTGSNTANNASRMNEGRETVAGISDKCG